MDSPVAQTREYVEAITGSGDRPQQKIRRLRDVREELVAVLGGIDTYISQNEQRLSAEELAATEDRQLAHEQSVEEEEV